MRQINVTPYSIRFRICSVKTFWHLSKKKPVEPTEPAKARECASSIDEVPPWFYSTPQLEGIQQPQLLPSTGTDPNEHLAQAMSSCELQEVFDYDAIPQEVHHQVQDRKIWSNVMPKKVKLLASGRWPYQYLFLKVVLFNSKSRTVRSSLSQAGAKGNA